MRRQQAHSAAQVQPGTGRPAVHVQQHLLTPSGPRPQLTTQAHDYQSVTQRTMTISSAYSNLFQLILQAFNHNLQLYCTVVLLVSSTTPHRPRRSSS